MSLQILGWQVWARDPKKGDVRFAAVSIRFVVRAAAEAFADIYRKQHPQREVYVHEVRGREKAK